MEKSILVFLCVNVVILLKVLGQIGLSISPASSSKTTESCEGQLFVALDSPQRQQDLFPPQSSRSHDVTFVGLHLQLEYSTRKVNYLVWFSKLHTAKQFLMVTRGHQGEH